MSELILKTLQGLEATAIKKINDLGVKAAQDDLERIKDMFEELVFFWYLDERLIDEYDEKIRLTKEKKNNFM